jgi:hypothetical protein
MATQEVIVSPAPTPNNAAAPATPAKKDLKPLHWRSSATGHQNTGQNISNIMLRLDVTYDT